MTETDDAGRQTVEAQLGIAIGRLGPRLLEGLDVLEQAFRRLHPPALPLLRDRLAPFHDALVEALVALAAVQTPEPFAAFQRDLLEAGGFARDALASLVEVAPGAARAQSAEPILRAMHQHARAQARLYPLRSVLLPVSAYFAEPFARAGLEALEAPDGSDTSGAQVGLFRAAGGAERGGFDLYVPESHARAPEQAWPLVVALHGGAGHGADFLWTWLREARSRRCFLLAPTSQGSTWSLQAPEVDGHALRRIVEWVASRWPVDRNHVLLTGLSDGATMTLLVGAAVGSPYTHLAPISGVLHPGVFRSGDLERMRGRPIYLVHGALDWMFPVALARHAANTLEEAGAALIFREIEDLSHAYPREENARIIEWFDPTRAVAASARVGD